MAAAGVRAVAATVATALALGFAAGCRARNPADEEATMQARTIEEVLEAHTDSLMAIPGVVGTAIGRCDTTPCIRVMVADSATARRAVIPNRLGGYLVRVDVTGPIRPRAMG
jgi:hypothetical protein